jgi:hypothetical protein
MLSLIGEQYPEPAQICGGVCSLRGKQDRVSVWTRDGEDEKKWMPVKSCAPSSALHVASAPMIPPTASRAAASVRRLGPPARRARASSQPPATARADAARGREGRRKFKDVLEHACRLIETAKTINDRDVDFSPHKEQVPSSVH